MEISLSKELMELLAQIVGTLTRVQFQYLLAIIPAVLIFLLYLTLNMKPITYWLRRLWLIHRLGKQKNSLAITMIHQATPSSILDVFKLSFITLDDSQKILQILKDYPQDRPIDLVLHTPGGMVIAAEQIARVLKDRKGEVHCHIPQYAMSGGTLIALACSHIHMGEGAVLGPLDPQLSIGLFETYPAVSIIEATKQSNPNRDDKTLILADIAQKAINQLTLTTTNLLYDKLGDKAKEVARTLCQGTWTHDFGITTSKALELGLSVDNNISPTAIKIVKALPRHTSIKHYKGNKKKQDDGQIRIQL